MDNTELVKQRAEEYATALRAEAIAYREYNEARENWAAAEAKIETVYGKPAHDARVAATAAHTRLRTAINAGFAVEG